VPVGVIARCWRRSSRAAPGHAAAREGGVASRISHVYDIHGRQEIALSASFETDIPFRKSDVPRVLKQAVVASEDRRFYSMAASTSWLPPARSTPTCVGAATRRAVRRSPAVREDAYINRERTLVRKLREAILASQLDRHSQEEILYRYLSTIYLGGGAYGVGAASQTYFRKPVKDLTLSESALLAASFPRQPRMTRAPILQARSSAASERSARC